MRNTRNAIKLIAGLALFSTAAFGQEVYTTWAQHKNVILNTAISGVNIAENVRNFPVLVRLGSADAAIFAQSVGMGADLRFTKGNNTTRIPHQIEKWDSAGQSASIWVLVDTVYGNSNNQSFRMHWGKAGAADSSSGPAVFKTANGFQAVWHMNSGGVGTENDATANAFIATPSATAPTNNPTGAIGSARTFNGSSAYLVALNTATGALNFPVGGPATLSAWVNSTVNGQKLVVGKSDYQYSLQLNGGSNYESCDFQDAAGWYCVAGEVPPTGQWIHFVSVMNAEAESLYVNGVLVNSSPALGASGNARNQTYNVFIGAMVSGTAPGTVTTGTKSRYWNGSIDEVEISSVARSANWIALSYKNQQSAQTLVSLSDTIPTFAASPNVLSRTTVQNVAVGGTAKFGVTVQGSGTLTFKWVKNNTDTVRTATGTTTDTLVLTNALSADNNATYKCVISNSLGSAVSASATLTVSVAVGISAQPSPKSVAQGGTTSFTITATGTNLTFKWVKNNTDTVRNVAKATASDTLTLSGVQVADNSSTYKCVVSNPIGQVVSTAAGLQVVGILPGSAAGSFAILKSGSSLTFRLPGGLSAAEVSIVDVWGREIWSRKVSTKGSTRNLVWEGVTSNGNRAANGVYVVRAKITDLSGASKTVEQRVNYTP